MAIILNIDTSSEKAQVSFAREGMALETLYGQSQKDHASFLQSAILELTKITGIELPLIDAVAVISGPGSYTGLRVGLSSAKGLCYALKKPLVTMNGLEVLTMSALQLFPNLNEHILFCPMVDARRMEVFTAVYNKDLGLYMAPAPLVLDGSSFEKELTGNKVLFFGTGSQKWEAICKHPNAQFKRVTIIPEAMSKFSYMLYSQGLVADMAYCEPLYLKDFQIVIKP